MAFDVGAAIAGYTKPVKISMRGKHLIKPPNLSDPQLKRVGELMVAAQKERWKKGIDGDGNPAKKLSVRYAIIKQKFLHKRPIRDMWMTGETVANFQLRKDADGRIRAENTIKRIREKAMRCQGYVEMIGFAGSDINTLLAASQREYGNYLTKALVQIR